VPTYYEVQKGVCISSIAFNHGFFWKTLWKDGSNSQLKSKRKDPNILHEGDTVHIPDLALKEESGATEQRHRFKLKGVPAKLKLKLMRPKLKAKKKEPSGSPAPGGGSAPGGLGGNSGGVGFITPIIIGDSKLTMDFSRELFQECVLGTGITFPTVPEGKARIRTIMTATHKKAELDQALEVLKKVGKRMGILA